MLLRIIAVSLIAIALNACSEKTLPLTETQKITSPSGQVDAVLTLDPNGGATVPTVSRIHIVPTGTKANPDSFVIKGYRFHKLEFA